AGDRGGPGRRGRAGDHGHAGTSLPAGRDVPSEVRRSGMGRGVLVAARATGRDGPRPAAPGPERAGDGGAVIRVLLVDDQPLVRAGLSRILRLRDGFEIVGECEDGVEALEAVA